MGPEQPDPQIAGSSVRRGPPRTVPKELLKLWGLLSRRERQRRRRRFFHSAHAACCSRPVTDDSLASLNARVKILEEALAEFLHATAASIPVPTHPAKKRDREGAELPPAPTPANIVSETLPDIPPAAEAARNAASPSPITSDFTSAADPCDLHGAALHGPDSSDVTSVETPHSAAARGRTSSSDTPSGATPHEAASHGTAVTGAVFNPHTDLPPPFYLHGIRSGWRAVTPPTDTDSDSDSDAYPTDISPTSRPTHRHPILSGTAIGSPASDPVACQPASVQHLPTYMPIILVQPGCS